MMWSSAYLVRSDLCAGFARDVCAGCLMQVYGLYGLPADNIDYVTVWFGVTLYGLPVIGNGEYDWKGYAGGAFVCWQFLI